MRKVPRASKWSIVEGAAVLLLVACGGASKHPPAAGDEVVQGADAGVDAAPTCGGTVVDTNVVPPNLLFVVDRSCSMTDVVGASTKWDIAVTALEDMMTANASGIRFGLELFPDKDTDKCGQGSITIGVSETANASIASTLDASRSSTDPNFPAGPCVTNIDTAVEKAATEPSFADTSRKSYVVLLTDGAQSGCSAGGGDSGTTTAITSMRQAGIGTFVIGFGSSADKTALNQFATAGGLTNPKGPQKFYDAADLPSLDAALGAIAAHAAGCSLTLTEDPPGDDPGLVYVFADDAAAPLPRDPSHASGWDYDPATRTVTFYGGACDDIADGATHDIRVVFGCPGSDAPPAPPIH